MTYEEKIEWLKSQAAPGNWAWIMLEQEFGLADYSPEDAGEWPDAI